MSVNCEYLPSFWARVFGWQGTEAPPPAPAGLSGKGRAGSTCPQHHFSVHLLCAGFLLRQALPTWQQWSPAAPGSHPISLATCGKVSGPSLIGQPGGAPTQSQSQWPGNSTLADWPGLGRVHPEIWTVVQAHEIHGLRDGPQRKEVGTDAGPARAVGAHLNRPWGSNHFIILLPVGRAGRLLRLGTGW